MTTHFAIKHADFIAARRAKVLAVLS